MYLYIYVYKFMNNDVFCSLMYLSFKRQKPLFLLKTFNFELNSSNKAILIQRKIQSIFLCCLWAFDQLEVPDGVYDGNLQSLVSISLAFKSWRTLLYRNLERRDSPIQFLGPCPNPVKPNLLGLFSGLKFSGSNLS